MRPSFRYLARAQYRSIFTDFPSRLLTATVDWGPAAQTVSPRSPRSAQKRSYADVLLAAGGSATPGSAYLTPAGSATEPTFTAASYFQTPTSQLPANSGASRGANSTASRGTPAQPTSAKSAARAAVQARLHAVQRAAAVL